ncbi:MAG TPA: GNAT family N-acetyltransferase, partial [Thermoanaerobaculia bacterium]
MPSDEVTYRPAVSSDALPLSVLATQVFLDTYAIEGVRPAIAREVRQYLSEEAFAALLADPRSGILIAELADHLVGFAQLTHHQTHALLPPEAKAAELNRLYVQRPFLGKGIGKELLARAEALAVSEGA